MTNCNLLWNDCILVPEINGKNIYMYNIIVSIWSIKQTFGDNNIIFKEDSKKSIKIINSVLYLGIIENGIFEIYYLNLIEDIWNWKYFKVNGTRPVLRELQNFEIISDNLIILDKPNLTLFPYKNQFHFLDLKRPYKFGLKLTNYNTNNALLNIDDIFTDTCILSSDSKFIKIHKVLFHKIEFFKKEFEFQKNLSIIKLPFYYENIRIIIGYFYSESLECIKDFNFAECYEFAILINHEPLKIALCETFKENWPPRTITKLINNNSVDK
jgi:hypothetical protein